VERSEVAVEKFKSGYCCSQSVLYSFADRVGLEPDLALKLADGFGAGMGRKQKVCGAISGAVLVLGLLYGRGEGEPEEKHEQTYAKVQELIERFEAQHGTVICHELLNGCDLLTPEGQAKFKGEQMIEDCYGFVADAVKILEDLT
jgi:C_GCAxxG_C_C family probable redox protein